MYRALFFLIFILGSQCLAADDEQQEADKDGFQWYLDIGLGLLSLDPMLSGLDDKDSPDLNASIRLELSYKGFFLETPRQGKQLLHNSVLGYHLYENKDWQVDIIQTSYMKWFNEEGYSVHDDTVVPELVGLEDRNADASIGLRTHYFHDNHQITLDTMFNANGIYDGVLIQANYSYLLPARNWDIILYAGATYLPSSLIDYYFGIRPSEAILGRPEFEAERAFRVMAGFSAIYPINKDWLFELELQHHQYSSNVEDSPIVHQSSESVAAASVRYVF